MQGFSGALTHTGIPPYGAITMKPITMKKIPSFLRVLCVVALSAGMARPCLASTNLLDGYIGAAYGHANLRGSDSGLISSMPGSRLGGFSVGDTAYQIIAGVRGLELLGVEVDYFDLGSGAASPSWVASGSYSVTRARISQRGEAAFAVLYLPVPIVDFYLKAGVARITSDLSASVAGTACPPGAFCPAILTGGFRTATGAARTTATTFAAGAGVQWQIGNWAIRGEYERFTALGENPSLITVGATWSFL